MAAPLDTKSTYRGQRHALQQLRLVTIACDRPLDSADVGCCQRMLLWRDQNKRSAGLVIGPGIVHRVEPTTTRREHTKPSMNLTLQ